MFRKKGLLLPDRAIIPNVVLHLKGVTHGQGKEILFPAEQAGGTV